MQEEVATFVRIPLISRVICCSQFLLAQEIFCLQVLIRCKALHSECVYCASVFSHNLGRVVGQLILPGCLMPADCLLENGSSGRQRISQQ